MKSSEGYEPNIAGFAKSRAKNPLANITENPTALFALRVKDVPGARDDLGV
jgi:hypothetical protein